MNYYITHSLMTYSPANNKCRELIEWIKKFDDNILIGDIAKDALKEEILHKIDELNKRYPRTKPLLYTREEKRYAVKIDSNQYVFFLSVSRVKSVYSFMENSLKRQNSIEA